jgi:hypothetical protein
MKPRRERYLTTLMLDKDLREGLKSLSDREDLSIAHLVRTFIKQGLKRELRDTKPAAARS